MLWTCAAASENPTSSPTSAPMSDTIIAHAFGEPITQADVDAARAEVIALAALGWHWQYPASDTRRDAELSHRAPLQLVDWITLSREARREVPAVPEQMVDDLLATKQWTAEKMRQAAKKAETTPELLRSAVGELLRIRINAAKRVPTNALPDAEVETLFKEVSERCRVRLCLLDGPKDFRADEPVSETEILEQFESHHRWTPESSPDGIGYRAPWRLKVQHMSLSVAEVAKGVSVTDGEVRAYFEAHRDMFHDPHSGKELPFEAVQEQARERLKMERARPPAEAAVKHAVERLRADWMKGKLGEDGFRIAPEEVQEAGYWRKMTEAFAAESKLPFVQRTTAWLPPAYLTQVPGLSDSFRTNKKGKPVFFRWFISQVQGRVARDQPDVEFLAALYEPSSEAAVTQWERKTTRFYIYRVIGFRVGPPPLEEIRPLVERDVRIFKGLERTRAAAEKLRDLAASKGLQAACREMPALGDKYGKGATVFTSPPFSRKRLNAPQIARIRCTASATPVVTRVGVDEGFVAACFKLAEVGSSSEGSRPVCVCVLKKSKQVAVVEWIESVPFDGDRPGLIEQTRERLKLARDNEALRTWYSPAEIRRRGGVD